jgi:hypothetical protein
MADKFYQFHYAEMNGFEIENLGILNCHFKRSITKQDLIDYTRAMLKKPNARIMISHITKLSKAEFEVHSRQKNTSSSHL